MPSTVDYASRKILIAQYGKTTNSRANSAYQSLPESPLELQAILNSYGDTLDDEEILSMLRDYNDKGSAFRDVIASH